MPERFAVIIAVENYQDSCYSKVSFAEADATAFSEVLVHHGFLKANQVILVNADATKARIDSYLRRAISRLTEHDELYVYFVGHGFSDGIHNYIVCHDTVWQDQVSTSLALQDIFEFLRTSDSHKIVMFLDTCHSGMKIDDIARSTIAGVTEDEIKEFFVGAEYYACFASCKASEKSYPSPKLGHGIWTHHLVAALSGEALDAIEGNCLVTSNSLQRYLRNAVPLELHKTRADVVVQTPVLFGNMTSDFLIADVADLIRKRRAAKVRPELKQLKQFVFYGEHSARVKSLSGFEKHHHVPNKADDRANAWIAKIAKKELDEMLDDVHQKLRAHLGYRRNEMDLSESDGSKTIITRDFTYHISVTLDPEDLRDVIWKREIVNLSNPDVVNTPEFEAVFENSFNKVEFEFVHETIDLADLIDQIEAMKDLEVNFPPDYSSCTIWSKDFNDFSIVVGPKTFTIETDKRQSPRNLLEGFLNIQGLLLSRPKMPELLPFK